MERHQMEQLRSGVHKAYSAVAERPQDEHPFPVGRPFAESVGYPKEVLDSLPSVCSDAFSGVSNVSIFADIRTRVHPALRDLLLRSCS